MEDFRQRFVDRIFVGPAGQGLGNAIEKLHLAFRIRGDHRITDAAERGTKPFPLFVENGSGLHAGQKMTP